MLPVDHCLYSQVALIYLWLTFIIKICLPKICGTGDVGQNFFVCLFLSSLCFLS